MEGRLVVEGVGGEVTKKYKRSGGGMHVCWLARVCVARWTAPLLTVMMLMVGGERVAVAAHRQ